MSLLSSIFGTSQGGAADLFEAHVEVPEPKPLPPADRSTQKKRKREKQKWDDERKEQEKQKSKTEPSSETEERTVFVGNLPLDTNRKSLEKIFAEVEGGKVENSRFRSVAVAGVKLPADRAGDQNLVKKVCFNTQQLDKSAKSCVQGYVCFTTKEAAESAVKLNGTLVGDRHIRVDASNPNFDATRSVFVGNLPYTADEETLKQHFCKVEGSTIQLEDIEGARIVRDKETFQCRGFGYVLFQNRSMVSVALQTINGTKYMKRELRIQVCGRRFKGKKGSEPKEKKEEPLGVLRRMLAKPEESKKKRRARGEKKEGHKPANAGGVSKRAAVDAKVEKRVKKIQKRITKGMGKMRK
jgi:nucleolar protein 12